MSLPDILEKCERFGLMLAGAAGPQLSDWSETHLAHALGWADYIQRVRCEAPDTAISPPSVTPRGEPSSISPPSVMVHHTGLLSSLGHETPFSLAASMHVVPPISSLPPRLPRLLRTREVLLLASVVDINSLLRNLLLSCPLLMTFVSQLLTPLALQVMELVDPQSPDAETFDLAIRVMQDRYAAEDPNGSIFVSRDRLDLSLRSLLRSRFELLRILLGNRSASQVYDLPCTHQIDICHSVQTDSLWHASGASQSDTTPRPLGHRALCRQGSGDCV